MVSAASKISNRLLVYYYYWLDATAGALNSNIFESLTRNDRLRFYRTLPDQTKLYQYNDQVSYAELSLDFMVPQTIALFIFLRLW